MWRYDDLSIVTEVVKQGSFIKASEALNIPSSTVSRRVSEFEQAIGVRLIERNARKFALTEQGAHLFEHAHPQLQTIKNIIQEIQTLNDQPSGKLKVTAPVTLGNELLSEWFCEFAQLYPSIEVEIILDNDHKDLIEEHFDVALRVGPLNDSNFIANYLFSSDFILCASHEFTEKNLSKLNSINDVSCFPFLRYHRKGSRLKLINLKNNESVETDIQASFSSTSTSVLRQAAMKGLGIACLPKISIEEQLNKGNLVHLWPDYAIYPRPEVYAIYPSKQHLPQKTRVFLDFLKNKASKLLTIE